MDHLRGQLRPPVYSNTVESPGVVLSKGLGGVEFAEHISLRPGGINPGVNQTFSTLPNLLRALIEWGVPVPPESPEADHFALSQGLQDEASSLLERMSHRRKNAGRKRSA